MEANMSSQADEDLSSAAKDALTINKPPTLASPDRPFTLNVGGVRFVTIPDSLRDSGYFKALLSGVWKWKPQEDGSYFVDADPSLFQHVLRYLRRQTPPIFYDEIKGHDIGMYIALLREAEYFSVDGLVKYLRERRYLQMVKVRCTVEELDQLVDVTEVDGTTIDVDYHVMVTTEKKLVGPGTIGPSGPALRGYGRPGRGGQSRSVWVADDDKSEDDIVMKLVKVRREVIVDDSV